MGRNNGVAEEVLKQGQSGMFIGEPEILEEEKRQILDQIEKSVSESFQPPVTEPLPRKKGLIFPLLVNLSALLIAAGVVTGSLQLFQVRRQQLDRETRGYVSAEGKILAEFRRESEEKLKEKDTAILRVLKQLGALENEREQLARIMELRIQEKEREMRDGLATDLEAEKQRLRQAGMPADAAAQRLLEFETDRKRRIFEELKSYQAQVDTLTRAKEQELLEEKQRTRLSLEKATQERERLLQDAQKQEVELRSRLRTEKGQSAAPSTAARIIVQAETLVARERLVTDQIAGAYALVGSALAGGRYPEASRELDALKTVFQEESFAGLPSIQRRRESDLKIITALEAFTAKAASQAPPAEITPASPPLEPAADQAGLETLRRQLREQETELAAMRDTLRRESSDSQQAVAQARVSAYEEILTLLTRLAAADSQASRQDLQHEVAQQAAREPLVERVFLAIQNLAEKPQTPAARSQETFRVLGTVTLAGSDSVTILPIVNMQVKVGARVEIRRILANGESVPVARGTISEVRPGRMVARIETLAGQYRASVTDKVYLQVE